MRQVLQNNHIIKYCTSNQMIDGEEEILLMIINLGPIEDVWHKISNLQVIYGSSVNNAVTADILPLHYSNNKMQPIFFIEKYSIGFSLGNIIKYLSRYKDKDGTRDLEKCKFYTDTHYHGNFEKYEEYKRSV